MKPIAVLDIGTNSFHLIIASVTFPNKLKILHREREIIRLTEGGNGIISQPITTKAVLTISKYKDKAKEFNAEFIVTATSAVRDAANKDEFVQTVFDRTGVNIRILSGLQEAEFIYKGVTNFSGVEENATIIDIGGGSTEIISGNSQKIFSAESLQLGAVRLSQQFFPDYNLSDEKIISARSYIEEKLLTVKNKSILKKTGVVIGTAGTIINIALIIKSMQKKVGVNRAAINNYIFSAEELKEAERIILSKKNAEERKRIIGLEKGREDIIPAGVLILTSFFKIFGITRMQVSTYGLREGILLGKIL